MCVRDVCDVCVRVCIFLYTVLLPDSLFVGRMSAGLERGSGGFPEVLPSSSAPLQRFAELQLSPRHHRRSAASFGAAGAGGPALLSAYIYRPLLLTPSSLAYPLSRFYQSHERRGATKRFLHVILGRGQVGHRSVWALVLNFGSRGQLSFVVILFGF